MHRQVMMLCGVVSGEHKGGRRGDVVRVRRPLWSKRLRYGDSCVRVRESEIGETAQGVGSNASCPRYGLCIEMAPKEGS